MKVLRFTGQISQIIKHWQLTDIQLIRVRHHPLKSLSQNDLIVNNDSLGKKDLDEIFKKIYPFVDNNIKEKINSKTKLIWVETPTNPMMNIVDIKKVCELAKDNKTMVAVDNTFATPYLQNPLSLGADIVMHSVTKYLGGHSDVVMGALVSNDSKIAEEIYRIQNSSGAVCGPMDSFLVLRGIKTLHLRMQRHCENGEKIANFLTHHPKVENVYWPGLTSHPNHDVAKSQMKDFGGMISFTLVGDSLEMAKQIVSKTELFTLAESLGGVESLIGHPSTMTHASIPREERIKSGVVDSLIRLSVGIEDVTDLIDDLTKALN